MWTEYVVDVAKVVLGAVWSGCEIVVLGHLVREHLSSTLPFGFQVVIQNGSNRNYQGQNASTLVGYDCLLLRKR